MMEDTLSELTNKYRDKINANDMQEQINALKVDLTNFIGALLQSGIVELVKDEQGELIYKINKVVLVDEQIQ